MNRANVLSAGNVALVTGAALGIGKATCQHFAKLGMKICVVDLPGDELDNAVVEIASLSPDASNNVMGYAVDISDPYQINNLQEEVTDRFGSVDFLMNNAVTRIGRGFDANISEWQYAMQVNFWGVVHCINAFLPTMQASGRPGSS